ncbi:MAG: methyltransferase domain-containing protein [Rhodospirillales bacterium]|nr:methyltransferase domain-containing protein [Rhodospirillales bacterium]MBO6787263.1 methyltransferase domain-containing protein [Rhodospirillales bacterium]
MREITRSNDPVFLSYLQAELAADGIEALVLDAFASSVLEPMNVTAQQRVMVGDDDYWRAWAVVEEAEERVTEDAILGGRVTLLQPKTGFRAAIDPILLAAVVPARPKDQVLDCGTGTGAAALALAARVADVTVTGIDVQPNLIALAGRAAHKNGMENRVDFLTVDIGAPEKTMQARMFDHVMSNPPFLDAAHGQLPKDPARALASVESTADLKTWVRFMADRLRDGGTLSLIHRHDRVAEIIGLLGDAFGNIRQLDLQPVDDGRPVKRSIVQATKGAPLGEVTAGRIVIHDADGGFTPEADAVLRNAEALPIS